jgi:carbamoyl-phosphate synthase large subunit
MNNNKPTPRLRPINKTILLTGAGGVALPMLINILQSKGYRVLSADMDPLAVGLYKADKGFVIPAGTSKDFLPAIKNICKTEKVDVFIPLVDEELEESIELEKENVKVILPQKKFVTSCLDKYVLMQELKKNNIPVPVTCMLGENAEHIPFPRIIKPKTGRGSRGVEIIKNQEEYDAVFKKLESKRNYFLVQECIQGTEFTVSVVVWKDGNVQAVVPKEIVSKKGVTKIAVTRFNKNIENVCLDIQKKLKANGPFNVQLCLDPKTQTPFIFEINPRFSTSITLTIAAGIDELNLLIEQALSGTSPQKQLPWKEGVVLMRQSLDNFMNESDFNTKQHAL